MESPFSKPFADEPKEPVLAVYRYVLEAFPTLGRAPTLAETKRDLGLEERAVTDALKSLEGHDALRLDPATGWIGEAYPYSPGETRHEVVFRPGKRVYCMCAIDCFYVPFLTDSDVAIYSSCHLCERAIEIQVAGQKLLVVEPSSTLVWDSDAPYDCPRTNFFCCEAHLREWRERTPDEAGTARSLDGALERGRAAAVQIRRAIGP
jgi:hypothetical protein